MHKVIFLLSILSMYAAAASGEEVQRIEMVAESHRFIPDHISVQAGIPVTLVIEKKGVTPHDFIIEDPASGLSIKESLKGTTTLHFTPERPGTFVFYCGKKLPFFKSHREKGMHGILEVH